MPELRGSLMVQGTTSDAGKSICVAGLARILKRKGISVAPFKPQNMALNSAVTLDGGEIGRAQALQAQACGLPLSTDFNPVLLKPSSDQGSQVIIQGKAVSHLEAKSFGNIKKLAFDRVLESYARLQQQYDVVLIEGAGSPAEINLRERDIANMGFAEAVDCPCVLVGDINRGGVFAHLTGTLNLLSASEQQRTRGFIINQFRGDLSLLQSGLDWLEKDTGKPVMGVLPFIPNLKLDAEDAVTIAGETLDAKIKVKVPVLSRISNHTDFDPLRWHPQVDFQFVGPGESLAGADLIILPGSKNVRGDMDFLRKQGWENQILQHLRYGGKLLGICGGFQMLGQSIYDPDGIESAPGVTLGLKLVDMQTRLEPDKHLTQVVGTFQLGGAQGQVSGYEIHCGESTGNDLKNYFAKVTDQFGKTFEDGVVSEDRQVVGTYIHGLFESRDIIAQILAWAGAEELTPLDWHQVREQELDRLADVMSEHLNLEHIIEAIRWKPENSPYQRGAL